MFKFQPLLMVFTFGWIPMSLAQTLAPIQVSASPKLLAPGIVSSLNPEFGTAISPDTHTIWFNRTSPDRSRITMLETHWETDHWTIPAPPAFVDTMYRYIDPLVQPDGKQLFFSSNRPLPGKQAQDYNLWFVQPNGIPTPEPLPATINTPEDEIYGSIAKNGNIYFARFSGKKAQIYVSRWHNTGYQVAEHLHLPNTDTASISNPAISPNEDFLVFASAQMAGSGSADLFISRKRSDGNWSTPQNLGYSINSAEADFAPSFSPDGKILFFTSERAGIVQDFPAGQRRPGDLYAVKFEEEDYPILKIAHDPVQILRLQAINQDIWTPFSEAYANADADQYIALHTADFIRANKHETKGLNTYRLDSQRHFTNQKKNNHRSEIAFSFFERVTDSLTASERGIFRYTSITSDGARQHFYGKFHVFHRNINGKWKIAVDYDSNEGNTIRESDFNAGLPPEVFEDLVPKPVQSAEAKIRAASTAFSKHLMEANWEAVAAAYTEDAKIFPPGSPIVEGHAAIKAFWASTDPITFHKVTPMEVKVNSSEAWDWGTYEGKSIKKEHQERSFKGKYTIVWKEIAPDNWKIYLDIWNNHPD